MVQVVWVHCWRRTSFVQVVCVYNTGGVVSIERSVGSLYLRLVSGFLFINDCLNFFGAYYLRLIQQVSFASDFGTLRFAQFLLLSVLFEINARFLDHDWSSSNLDDIASPQDSFWLLFTLSVNINEGSTIQILQMFWYGVRWSNFLFWIIKKFFFALVNTISVVILYYR